MFEFLAALLTALVSAGMMFFTYRFCRNQTISAGTAERDKLTMEIDGLNKNIEGLLKHTDAYASKGQLDNANEKRESAKTELERERQSLVAIEPKLEQAQKTVEEKEFQQQELKSAREEDELKLQEILGRYSDLSSESSTLEQQLAQSMQSLDTMMSEVQLTPDQRGVLLEFQRLMTESGASLRDLIVEYDNLNERLTMLQLQLRDLEEEYTKLVEKQLGE